MIGNAVVDYVFSVALQVFDHGDFLTCLFLRSDLVVSINRETAPEKLCCAILTKTLRVRPYAYNLAVLQLFCWIVLCCISLARNEAPLIARRVVLVVSVCFAVRFSASVNCSSALCVQRDLRKGVTIVKQ